MSVLARNPMFDFLQEQTPIIFGGSSMAKSLLLTTIGGTVEAYDFALRLGEICQRTDFRKKSLAIRVIEINSAKKQEPRKKESSTLRAVS